MEGLKKALREGLRMSLPRVQVPGRYRVADRLGARLAPAPPVEVVDVHGLRVAFDHRHLSCRTMYYGIYEEAFVRFLQRTLRPGDTFLDLGANIGYITAVVHGLVGPGGRVLAFEPSRTCYERLRADNPQWPTGVDIRNTAITDQVGTHAFMDTERVVSLGFSALFHNREAGAGDRVYEVPTTSIDGIVEEHGLRDIACVKMDIEGAELIALKGASATLAQGIARHILVEMTNMGEKHQRENERIVEVLERHGYTPHLPEPGGRLRPFPMDLGKTFREDVIWRPDRH